MQDDACIDEASADPPACSTDGIPGVGAGGSPGKSLAVLRVLYIAMIVGVVIFTAIGIFVAGASPSWASSHPAWSSVPPAIAGGVLLISLIAAPLARARAWGDRLDDARGLDDRLEAFVRGGFLYGAIIEGPALLGAVVTLLCGPIYAVLPAVGVVFLVIGFPRRSQLFPGENPYRHRGLDDSRSEKYR